MFANMLEETERGAFIKLLTYLSMVDGELSKEEAAFIMMCCSELEIVPAEVFGDVENIEIDLDEVLSDIKSTESKNIIVLELVNLAHADKKYTDDERLGVRQIAEKMGVPRAKVDEIEEWVNEGLKWADRGTEIISA